MVSLIVLLVFVVFPKESEQKADLSLADGMRFVYPEFFDISGRKKRKIEEEASQENTVRIIKLGDWIMKVNEGANVVVSPDLVVEWINPQGSKTFEALEKCNFHQGSILGSEEKSSMALTVCGSSVIGMIYVGRVPYFVEPVDENTGEHIIYQSKKFSPKWKRSVSKTPENTATEHWIYNLTGDMIDIGNDDAETDGEIEFSLDMEDFISTNEELENGNLTSKSDFQTERRSNYDSVSVTGGKNTEEIFTFPSHQENWHRERIDEREEDNGYFYDSAWSANVIQVRQSTGSILPPRWLEIAIAVDHTLTSFHGKGKVERYVLSLMNIVSAIYQDPSLDANIKLVITRMIIYEHKKYSIIRQGNARRSLENVNTWNKRLHSALPAGKSPHDIAVWLTRSDIGGPSGYAPVSGTCDPKRSCALTRDEGLTSAFIIAHETAHILGLSHDGDRKNNNDCTQEALDGSIMAPMVSATFNKFSWSHCSKKEFLKNLNKWTCLLNAPTESGDIILNATLQTTFTMDEQCRMEFGDGYSMCRAFEIVEPCSHLWCGHESAPLVCKTKKGPPLEGTECDFGKWCVNGYCQQVGNTRIGRVPVVFNSLDGGWNDWAPWGPCSRSCGTGVQFRSRRCNNPAPSHGGKFCSGESEDWQICIVQECTDLLLDLRSQQCKLLPRLLNLEIAEQNATWTPHESDLNDRKCKLICINEDRQELYSTNENLMDGTTCSYDNEDNICIQGKCHIVGCDQKLHSEIRRDRCGVCGGNNSTCADINSQISRKLKREIGRVALLPKMARQITVEVDTSIEGTHNPLLVFILKSRRRKKYVITIPNTSVHKKVLEGTKFSYKKFNNRHILWASGPLHAEMVIMIVASKKNVQRGVSFHSKTRYSIQKDFLNPSKRFVWINGGWGPCSASCGGGRRLKTRACWDNLEDKLVKKNRCSLLQKPKVENEKCNTFGCNFQWLPGDWEPCSSSCGRQGIQRRELYCIPDSLISKIYRDKGKLIVDPWTYMVNPKRCRAPKPVTSQSCNRIPCFSYWTTGNWSQCSSLCGMGHQTRSLYCPSQDDEFFTCGDQQPTSKRHCRGDSKQLACRRPRSKCRNDKSEFCSFTLLHKYCNFKGFRQLCCASCKHAYTFLGIYATSI